MQYVEIMRALRLLRGYAIAMLASVALNLVVIWRGAAAAIAASDNRHSMIPFAALVAGAVLSPIILAAFFATGLDAEYQTAAIAWTRPISRIALAARYVMIDLIGMLAMAVLTFVTIFIVIAMLGVGKFIVAGNDSWVQVLLLFGVSVMWYGLVVLVAALLPGRGKAIAGASWAYVLIVPSLAQAPLPDLIHRLLVGLSYLSPLMYADSHGSRGTFVVNGGSLSVLVAWAIGIVAIVLGTQIWSRREVPA